MTAPLTMILRKLAEHEVDYILVGGMAAVLHGAPIATQDIDIVPKRDPGTASKLVEMLTEVNARYRGRRSGGVLRPSERALLGPGHNNLMTDLGPLDILGEISGGRGYEELLPHTEIVTDGTLTLRVLKLEKLVETKIEAGRPKDRLVLPILMKLLEP